MPFELSLTDSPSQRRAKIVLRLDRHRTPSRCFASWCAPASTSCASISPTDARGEAGADPDDSQGKPRGAQAALYPGRFAGPKIRTSKLKDHLPVLLKAGGQLTITPRDVPGTAGLVGTTFKTLAENVEQGSHILLSDGLIELRVHDVDGTTWCATSSTAVCWVKQGHQSARHCGARALVD